MPEIKMVKKCKRGSKGRVCRLKKKSSKFIPMKGKKLFVWITGALIEVFGFYFLFGQKQYFVGIPLIIIGLITALSSRTMR